MRTLTQHLVMEYTYEQALAMGANAYLEGLGDWINPFMNCASMSTSFSKAEDMALAKLAQAWDTGFKLEQKRKV